MNKKLEKNNYIKKLNISYISIAGITQFFIISGILMIIYPGGYSFSRNTISQLGNHFSAINLKPNLIGHDFLLLSYLFLSVGLGTAYYILKNILQASAAARGLTCIAFISGLVSLPGFVISHIFANDTYHEMHMIIAGLTNPLIVITILFFSLAILFNPGYSRILGILGIANTLYIITFLIMEMSPIVQKIVFFGSIGWFLIQIIYIIASKNKQINSHSVE